MNVERIYIGGLDPPRLSGKDVASRLRSLDIEVHSIEDKGKCFIHLTATSSGDKPALDIISQKYNNVKWKGCRLAVAEAKPHFLQRLAVERQEREEREAHEKEHAELTTEPAEEEEDTPSRIPRRLRIRKKFGDEAFHVDTRPWSVDNWKNFYTAKKKLRKRADNHTQKVIKIKEMKDTAYTHAPLMHRAVHIRFGSIDNRSQIPVSRAVSSSDEYEASQSEPDKSEKSDGSEEESLVSSEGSKDAEETKETKAGSYNWSDDSDVDSSSDDDMNNEDTVAHSVPETSLGAETIEQDGPPTSKKEYQWSSESSSDESSVHIRRTRDFKELAVGDEFAAGLDDGEGDDSDQEDYIPASEKNAKDAAYQMDNDVSANLGVLAELFPDMKGASPQNPKDDVDEQKETSKSSNKRSMPFGIMPRYDPTAATAQKYEVKEDGEKGDLKDAEGSLSEDDEISKDESESADNNEKSGDDEKKTEIEEEKVNVYHQGKLEDVFREARDAWQVQSTQTIQKKEESTGAFAFGFDLGIAEPEKEAKNDGGFSFGFDLPPDTAPGGNAEEKPTDKEEDARDEEGEKMDVGGSKESDPIANMRRRRGLRFSNAEMQSYEVDFFAQNCGDQIVDDLQGFRNDADEREQWLRERQALTLDWKRKRKHALSRIQKRVRNK